MTTLTTGFAAAAEPIAAQTTVATDTTGLTAGEVRVKTADRKSTRLNSSHQ